MDKLTKQEVENAIRKIQWEYNDEDPNTFLTPEQHQRFIALRAIKGLWAEKYGYNMLLEFWEPKFIKTNVEILDKGRAKDIDILIDFPWDIKLDIKTSTNPKYLKTWNKSIFDWYYFCGINIPQQYTEEIEGYTILKGDITTLYDPDNVIFDPHGFYSFEQADEDGYIKNWKIIPPQEWYDQVWRG